MNYPTVISFYTPDNDDGYYAMHASRMKKECADLGLETWIKKVEFNGRPWEQVLKEKPGVILEALRTTGGRSALWIDVDGSILHTPEVIMEALRKNPLIDIMAVPKMPEAGRPFYMGCVFYNNTDGARWFLQEWQKEYAKEDSEELAFGRAWNTVKGMVVLAPLPKDYMRIDGKDPIVRSTVVIHRLSKGKTKADFYTRIKAKR